MSIVCIVANLCIQTNRHFLDIIFLQAFFSIFKQIIHPCIRNLEVEIFHNFITVHHNDKTFTFLAKFFSFRMQASIHCNGHNFIIKQLDIIWKDVRNKAI